MPAHTEHLVSKLRGPADPRRRRTASAHPWRAAAVRRLLCISLLLHRSAAGPLQPVRAADATHRNLRRRLHIVQPPFFVSAPAVADTRCLRLCAAVCAFGKGGGASPHWMISPAIWTACARLRAALAGMIERLFARSILCEIKGGGRKRPPPSHKAPRCGAFSKVKQGEPCASFFGCKVVGKAKKPSMASLCAVSCDRNRRVINERRKKH